MAVEYEARGLPNTMPRFPRDRLKPAATPAPANAAKTSPPPLPGMAIPAEPQPIAPRHRGWRLPAWLAALILAWSFNYIFGKWAIRGLAPASQAPALDAAGLRILIAAVLLDLLALHPRLRPRGIRWRELGALILLGLTGVTLNQFLFVWGLDYTSVAHAALMFALTPVLVLALAAAWGQERPTWLRAAGMAVAVAGTALVVLRGATGGAAPLGDLIELGSAAAFAYYTVAGKDSVARFDTLSFTFYTYQFGALLMLPLVLPALLRTHWGAVTGLGWGSVAYMALAGSLAAYFIFYDVMKRLSAFQVSVLQYLQPVVAGAAAIYLLAEPVTTGLLVGGAVILGGVYLSER